MSMLEVFLQLQGCGIQYKVQIRPTDIQTKEMLTLYSVLGFTGHMGKAMSWKFRRRRSKLQNIHIVYSGVRTGARRVSVSCWHVTPTATVSWKEVKFGRYINCSFGTYFAVKQTDIIEDFELLITQGHKIQIFCNNIFQICNFKIS